MSGATGGTARRRHVLEGFEGLPTGLRRFVFTVTALGPAACIAAFEFSSKEGSSNLLLYALLLVALATLAEAFPLLLTHKTSVNMAGAAYVAMILLLPAAYPGMLALLAAGIAHTYRLRRDTRMLLPEQLFNTAQTGLYVLCGAMVYAGLNRAEAPRIDTPISIGAIVSMVIAMHLVNTLLVATAAALQLHASPLRVWWRNIALDLTPQVALTIIGATAAVIAVQQPLILPVLVLPLVLIHRAVSQTIRLRIDTLEALASLVEVIELRDPYTAGHSRRVATIARLIAERMGLTAEEVDLIESAGRVHDIGKVAIDPAILMKPDALTPAEWEQMKPHPVHGANVVVRFAAYQDGAKLVRHHHERWDGRGYPDGIAGMSIPLGARILAVADTFDALISDRPYRSGLDLEATLAILRGGRGSQWDPRVVDELCALIEEHPEEIPVQERTAEMEPLPSNVHQLHLIDLSRVPVETGAPAETGRRPA